VREKIIPQVKRLVVKIGTSTVIKSDGEINTPFITELAETIAALRKKNIETCIVCSGAVGAGKAQLNLARKPKRLPQRQALAAVGQIFVMSAFAKIFKKFDMNVGQVLLTHEVLTDRVRYLNARFTMNSLFEYSCIPIINENDTVATEELKVGDNDTLAAYVTNLIEADLLILLSDIDGLMTDDPKKNPNASLISEVAEVTDEIFKMAGPTKSDTGTGGLITKLTAARIVNQCGEAMIIANSSTPNIVNRIMDGENIGTFFCPGVKSLQSRKRWLAFNQSEKGAIIIDEGAATALTKKGKSLLPSGILKIEGIFADKDLVQIKTKSLVVIGKGISNYSSEQVKKIKGLQTKEIEKILGTCPYDSVIHRDNLVLVEGHAE
jgi:glutamate 5-kinase